MADVPAEQLAALVAGADLPGLEDLAVRPAWHRRAACRDTDVRMIVNPASPTAVARATAICDGCPSLAPCLDTAMADPSIVGVWGGTTERDRARMRRAAS